MTKPALKTITAIAATSLFILLFVYSNEDRSHDDLRKAYAHKIKTDPFYAYNDFKNSDKASHFAAHVFGEELFENIGSAGVKVCDDSYEFGCYHGFFTAGINKKGESIIHEFDQACRAAWGERYLPCQHGIGHGLMASGIDLPKALQWCKSITWQPTGGCSSGVFMEYNFPTNPEHTGSSVRKTNNSFYEPCDKVSDDFLDACYFELPQLWLAQTGNDLPEVARRCAQAQSQRQQWCFYGFGNYITPLTGFEPEEVRQKCEALIAKIQSEWCLEAASWLFLPRPDSEGAVQTLCGKIPSCLERLKQNPFYEN